MTSAVNALTTSITQRITNSITFAPSWIITRRNMLDLYTCNCFQKPQQASNPNPRKEVNPLFHTHCSTKPNIDIENASDNKSSPYEKDNSSSNLQEQKKPTSNQTLSSSNLSFSRGLVFYLGSNSSWDSVEIGAPVVKRYLNDEERWYMWYHGRSEGNPNLDSIGLAVSSNGVHWERSHGRAKSSEDTGLVMDCSKDWWAFDTQSIKPCEVVIMSSAKVRANAVYWLYYTGFTSEIVEFWDNSVEFGLENPERVQIQDDESRTSNVFKSLPGLAMSQDGRHWARIEGEHHTGALFDVGSKGEWDSMFIASPQVVFHVSCDLRMFYHSFDVENGVFAVGLARSRDGIKWVKLGKIIGGGGSGAFDELGVVNARVVRNRNSGKYVMVYEGVAADGKRSIGLAVSKDGLKNWQRLQGEAVLKPSEEDGWDNKGVGSPCLVQMDGDVDEWRLYYRGIGIGGETGIGMAVSEGNEIRSFRRWAGFHL